MFPRQAVYKLLLRQGLINFARVGTAVPCLPSMFRYLSVLHTLLRNRKQRIEVSFLCNQLIERACLNNGTVLQSDNAIVLF